VRRPAFYQLADPDDRNRLGDKLYKWDDFESDLASDARAEAALVFQRGPNGGLVVSNGGNLMGEDEARLLLDALGCL